LAICGTRSIANLPRTHAAILAATANLENAKTEAAQLKREQLLPEEQALVESLLRPPPESGRKTIRSAFAPAGAGLPPPRKATA
jgi:hypothetical protein